jgi:hypothetical protein
VVTASSIQRQPSADTPAIHGRARSSAWLSGIMSAMSGSATAPGPAIRASGMLNTMASTAAAMLRKNLRRRSRISASRSSSCSSSRSASALSGAGSSAP